MKEKRIASNPDLDHARVDPEIAEVMKSAATRFAKLGAEVRRLKMSQVARSIMGFLLTTTASIAAFQIEQLTFAQWPTFPSRWIGWFEFLYPFNMPWNSAGERTVRFHGRSRVSDFNDFGMLDSA